jgi:predicted ATP-grasp superfamily ATP-dependent carboligase
MTPKNNPQAPQVGVVGASARAAVHSLARGGFTAWAVDLFGDRDLERVAATALCPIDRYPDGIPELASRYLPGPVLYTGGLENHPPIISKLVASRELWGNPAEVVERVRDPHALSAFLADKGFGHPRVLSAGEACPSTGRWLLKARRSSGGMGVRDARAGEVSSAREYLQEFVPGPSMSAVFVAGQSRIELAGVTEQLIGTTWLHASGYKYAGNIGPAAVSAEVTSQLDLLGRHLMAALGLRGVFGVDFVLHDGAPWVVEINPRYPASVEVVELGLVKAVFGQRRDPATDVAGSPGVVGKAIYYAPHRISFPTTGPWDADLAGRFDPWRLPGFADIPHPGAIVEPGWPVLTIMAAGSSPAEVRERLQSRAAEVDELLADRAQ